ncbi:ATP-binding cassette domain-containing protein [Clostridium sp. CX1]|uniref:ATP-binding cassette domain-containing protein n=1 Tax=Clostridium tanneri TaxID=3037988 RepID=A0ABU4JYU6_9CLOT|nr:MULTISPECIES: ATP-binding cassette domain-containing protein [unclassified Clostridium]MCT8977249.1 ATP-binding cassette domain-containing protein [Clostridium sp. CX1]MDW8803084.1 ATP-binding cassette domain-containing protein [Clostridium sp. A1-XYC3]
MKKSILEVEDLYYVYGNGKSALEGVSVSVYEGEKIAVLGSNGSGKSTFFLNINGVFTAEQGKIIYRDTVINKKNLKELRKNIGIVFQDADNQIIASTVMAEVGFGPMNLKLPKEEVQRRVDEALAYMNISDFKDRPPHYLSGGEKKRVTIADIIAMKSEIIIFDEPMAALDPLNALMLEEVLDKLSSEGKTMLISTHDVDFAYRWAERILVFYQGQIIADGTPLEIFQDRSILKRANLKQPTMLEVYEMLVEKNVLEDTKVYPKSTEELEKVLEKQEISLGDLA